MGDVPRLVLFPLTAEINKKNHLAIAGCDTVELAKEFGTPLYLFDEATIRSKCAEYKSEFTKRYPNTLVQYACKAFINKQLLLMIAEEGLGLDVVSGGEISIADAAGFPMDRVSFPGNNKSVEELALALEKGVGRIVVDNFHDLETLGKIARKKGVKPSVLIRISPGVDPHTHQKIITGSIDSKFGFPMVQAEDAVAQALTMPELNVVGLHFHIGSQISEADSYLQSVGLVLNLAHHMSEAHGFKLNELSVGGGYSVQYTVDSPSVPVSFFAEALTSSILKKCKALKMKPLRLYIEPGRSIVAKAGVALYTAGVVKDIPDVRRYVSVDGGMADNIRPALYGAVLEAIVANKASDKDTDTVTISGKFCESGDILIKDIALPPITSGDVIAVPVSGAYCIPEAMNYNAFCKPAIVMVKEGKARLIRRRETIEDLMRCDIE